MNEDEQVINIVRLYQNPFGTAMMQAELKWETFTWLFAWKNMFTSGKRGKYGEKDK